jgi:hypothetical protein
MCVRRELNPVALNARCGRALERWSDGAMERWSRRHQLNQACHRGARPHYSITNEARRAFALPTTDWPSHMQAGRREVNSSRGSPKDPLSSPYKPRVPPRVHSAARSSFTRNERAHNQRPATSGQIVCLSAWAHLVQCPSYTSGPVVSKPCCGTASPDVAPAPGVNTALTTSLSSLMYLQPSLSSLR